MSTRWASGSIAGVDVVDLGGRACRMDVMDGEGFRGTMVGDSIHALDLTTHTQVLDRSGIGIHFGLQIAQIPIEVLDDIVQAMNGAVATSDSFVVTVSDSAGADNIDHLCVPDFAAMDGGFYKRGAIAGGYAKEVLIRLISVGPNV